MQINVLRQIPIFKGKNHQIKCTAKQNKDSFVDNNKSKIAAVTLLTKEINQVDL